TGGAWTLHHLRGDAATVGKHDRVTPGNCCAFWACRYAESIQPIGKQSPPRLFFEQVAEALGTAMRHREGGDMPPRPRHYRAGRDSAQAIAGFMPGSDRDREIAAGKGDGFSAADDLDGTFELVKL